MTLKRMVISGIILVAALSRLLPHPPNFTPIIAMGLMGGVYFKNKQLAVIIPLLAMMVSDLLLGFHGTMIWVYSSIAIVTLCSSFIKPKLSTVGLASFSASIFFFLVTNFGVWISGTFYPKTLSGLGTCYMAGIPFLQNAIVGDLMYTAILFGAFEMAKKSIPQLGVDAA